MQTDALFISPKGAFEEGTLAVEEGRAASFRIRFARRRNRDDHSIEQGYVVILKKPRRSAR